jgi:cbb3-type cytochrome oxidase subunit 3
MARTNRHLFGFSGFNMEFIKSFLTLFISGSLGYYTILYFKDEKFEFNLIYICVMSIFSILYAYIMQMRQNKQTETKTELSTSIQKRE